MYIQKIIRFAHNYFATRKKCQKNSECINTFKQMNKYFLEIVVILTKHTCVLVDILLTIHKNLCNFDPRYSILIIQNHNYFCKHFVKFFYINLI